MSGCLIEGTHSQRCQGEEEADDDVGSQQDVGFDDGEARLEEQRGSTFSSFNPVKLVTDRLTFL